MTAEEMLQSLEKHFEGFTHSKVTKPLRFAVFNPYGNQAIWMFQIWVSLAGYPREMLVSMDCSDHVLRANNRVMLDFVCVELMNTLILSCENPPIDYFEGS